LLTQGIYDFNKEPYALFLFKKPQASSPQQAGGREVALLRGVSRPKAATTNAVESAGGLMS
jgi:hypothetical protein